MRLTMSIDGGATVSLSNGEAQEVYDLLTEYVSDPNELMNPDVSIQLSNKKG